MSAGFDGSNIPRAAIASANVGTRGVSMPDAARKARHARTAALRGAAAGVSDVAGATLGTPGTEGDGGVGAGLSVDALFFCGGSLMLGAREASPEGCLSRLTSVALCARPTGSDTGVMEEIEVEAERGELLAAGL